MKTKINPAIARANRDRAEYEAMPLETLENFVAHRKHEATVQCTMNYSAEAMERAIERLFIAEDVLSARHEAARKLVEES